MSLRIPLVGAALLCVALLFVSAAEAGNAPVAGGRTEVIFDKGFSRLLDANGVQLATEAGARRRGRSLLLPVLGGSLDPTAGRGEIETGGTLVFRHGRHRVKLRKVEVKTKREPLVAKVGGSQLKVASAGRLSFERVGFGFSITARPLRLTAKFATRLGKKLGLRNVFEAGQKLGILRSQALPQTLGVLPVGRATFSPSPEFLAKLDSLFVSLNPVAPAERAPGPIFTVPLISEGTISPDAASGVPRTGGALEFLQLGSGQVFWQELWFDLVGQQVLAEVDVEPSPIFPGKLGQRPILGLGQGAVSSDPADRTVTITGAPLTLGPESAAQFNQAFAAGEETFHAGELVGALGFVAQAE